MNWKIVFIGGGAYYLANFLLSMVLGIVIHDPQSGILAEAYAATMSFWRPELFRDSLDMGLMFRILIPSGLLSAFLGAGIYSVIRPALTGAAWLRGLKFGAISVIFGIISVLSYRRVLNLPDQIWSWWIIGSVIVCLPAGVVLGWVSQKLSPAAN